MSTKRRHDWVEVEELAPVSAWARMPGPWARVRLRCRRCIITAILYVRAGERGIVSHDLKYQSIRYDWCSASDEASASRRSKPRRGHRDQG